MPTKEYYLKNKEKLQKYAEENKEYYKEKEKEYHKNNPHKKKIRGWKGRGIKLREGEDWDSIYLYYITCEECESCGVELTDEKLNTTTRRCLDHDHSTGFIRDVLCHTCNNKRR